MSDKSKSGYEIRQGLLGQAQSIIEQNSAMEFEQTKKWTAITTEAIVAEAEKLYEFVKRKA
jgi:hypothetical protein